MALVSRCGEKHHGFIWLLILSFNKELLSGDWPLARKPEGFPQWRKRHLKFGVRQKACSPSFSVTCAEGLALTSPDLSFCTCKWACNPTAAVAVGGRVVDGRGVHGRYRPGIP